MKGRVQFERSLRWYPPEWRERYGDELVALLEDTYGDRPVPVRCRLSLARAGLRERTDGSGLEGDGDQFGTRVRSGALLVLCAWSVFVVAGAGFAKFSEHWDAVTPKAAQWLPADAYYAVQWAAQVAGMVVLIGAVIAVPAFVRSIRQGGWASIRRPVLWAAAVTSTTVLVSVGIIAWAHTLGPHSHTESPWPYRGVGALWVLMITASIATCSFAAVSVVRRLRLTSRTLKVQGVLAMMVTAAMTVVVGGVLVWWAAVATDARGFFGHEVLGSTGSPAPPALVTSGILMLLGLVIALVGVTRVARSWARLPAD